MKIFLIIFVILNTPSIFAKNISDFQIEGISIGDSLLNYFNEEEILKFQRSYKSNKEFISSEFPINSSKYDTFGAYYKFNDKNYIIHGILGLKMYEKNIQDCYNRSEEISKLIIKNYKNKEWEKRDLEDVDGYFTFNNIYLDSGILSVGCYDWNLAIEKKKAWLDHLRVRFYSHELQEWHNKNYTTYNN